MTPAQADVAVVTGPGNDPSVWRNAVDDAPRISVADLARGLGVPAHRPDADRGPSLLIVGAHPDDETIGAGRLAAAWAAHLGPVFGLLASAGEACVDQVATRPAGLAVRRLEEWRTATLRLGFTDAAFLALPDGRLDEHEAAITEGLRALIIEIGADRPVVLAAPWRRDPHPDHRAVGRSTEALASELGLPMIEFGIWMTYWSEPAELAATGDRLLVLDHDQPTEDAYQHACRAFVSQLEPLAPGLTAVVPPAMLAQHRSGLIIASADAASTMIDPLPGRNLAMSHPGLSVLAPIPAPTPLPGGYLRHQPDNDQLRTAIHGLAAAHDWAELSWTELIGGLLGIGRTDIPLGRLVEGHIDAMRICHQAGAPLTSDAIYGVWASKSGATGARATAVEGGFRIDGMIKFASGAGLLDRALVPVSGSHDHQLLLDLPVSGLPVDASAWQTSAMTVSRTHSVELTGLEVSSDSVVGPADFYLGRLGFFPGGVGVAAVWAGGLARVADLLLGWLDGRRSPLLEARLGAVRLAVATAAAAVGQAGQRLDQLLTADGQARVEMEAERLPQLAGEARAIVGYAVRAGLEQARLIAGPAGLAFDLDLTRAIDDLGLYVLQQNRDGDAVGLGRTFGAER